MHLLYSLIMPQNKIDEYLPIAGIILGGLGAIGSLIYFFMYVFIFFAEEKEDPSKFSWVLAIFLTLGILLCVFYFFLCILLIKGILDVSIHLRIKLEITFSNNISAQCEIHQTVDQVSCCVHFHTSSTIAWRYCKSGAFL